MDVKASISEKVLYFSPYQAKYKGPENIYTLNETAARIWEMIDGKMKVEEIKEKLIL